MKSKAELEQLSRREVQALAKEAGVKANSKTACIIADLLAHWSNLQTESLETNQLGEDQDDGKNKTQDTQQEEDGEEVNAEEKPEFQDENHKVEQGQQQSEEQEEKEPLRHLTLSRATIAPNLRRRPSRGGPPNTTHKSTQHNGKKRTQQQATGDRENKENTSKRTKRKGDIRSKFDKAHEKMFSTQKSIVDVATPAKRIQPKQKKHTKKKEEEEKALEKEVLATPSLAKSAKKRKPLESSSGNVMEGVVPSVALKSTVASERGKKQAVAPSKTTPFIVSKKEASQEQQSAKRPKFDLQESLKRPITWKMKTGPLR